jgi:CheW-like domain.
MEKELISGEETKEIEILEFHAGGNTYGIDINDIREILPYNKIPRKIPNSNPYIEGIIKPRDFIIPVINLVDYLKLKEANNDETEMLIVSNIKDMNIGFHVDSVDKIHKTTAAGIKKPGKKLSTPVRSSITGILEVEERKIEILDLRHVISDINPDIKFD